MIEKWTIISAEDVSPSVWFPIEKHKIALPDQTIIDDYYIATLGNVAMVLPVTTENEIVLVKQYKHGLGEVMIELPAGNQDHQLSIQDTALKELEEETGIKTLSENLISLGKIANNPTKTNHTTYGFIAFGLTFNSNPSLDSTENIEILKVSPKDVIQMILNGEIFVGDTVSFIMKVYFLYPKLFV